MKEAVARVVKASSRKHKAAKHKAMTLAQERKVRDEVSDFVAELLARRAAQLEKFTRTGPRTRSPTSPLYNRTSG